MKCKRPFVVVLESKVPMKKIWAKLGRIYGWMSLDVV